MRKFVIKDSNDNSVSEGFEASNYLCVVLALRSWKITIYKSIQDIFDECKQFNYTLHII